MVEPPPSSEPPAPEPPPRRFLRSRDDVVVGGVCSGLAQLLGVDPLLVRIAAVALAFVGGVSLVAYVLALAFVPQDDGTGQPAPTSPRRSAIATAVGAGVIILAGLILLDGGWGWHPGWVLGPLVPIVLIVGVLAVAGRRLLGARGEQRPTVARIVGVGLVLVAAVIGAFALALGSAWATAAGAGAAIAAAVIALGVAMIVLAFQHRRARWLAVPALLLALPAGVVSAADVDLDGGIGERSYRPATTADLRPVYRVGTGELVVDLRDLVWPADAPVTVHLDAGIGHALVVVPPDVCVQSHVESGMGWIGILGEETGGADLDDDRGTITRYPGRRLILDADMGIGAVEVRHDRGHHGPRRGSGTRIDGALADAGCAGKRA